MAAFKHFKQNFQIHDTIWGRTVRTCKRKIKSDLNMNETQMEMYTCISSGKMSRTMIMKNIVPKTLLPSTKQKSIVYFKKKGLHSAKTTAEVTSKDAAICSQEADNEAATCYTDH